MAKLKKPALVGNTRFGVGVDERMVIERAQREYEYQVTPEKEAERMKRVTASLEELRFGDDGLYKFTKQISGDKEGQS